MQNKPLLQLLQLSDPALPIGGFAHSAGLETYVQAGIIHNKETAELFVRQQLGQNIHYTDAAFVSLSFQAARKNDLAALLELDRECTAVKLPREVREASIKLGKRLIKIFLPLYNHTTLKAFRKAIDVNIASGHYCILFGIVASVMDLEIEDALTGFFYNAAMGMITNSVKLIPLSQQDGQEIIFDLHDFIGGLIKKSVNPDRKLIGFCCTGFDIRSMQHERLYTRLYIS